MGNELVLAGAALGSIMLLERHGQVGTALFGKAGPANTAAVAVLRGHSPIAGAAFTIPSRNSASDAYFAIRNALTSQHGEIDANIGQHYPSGLTIGQCKELADAWLDAFDAGYHAQMTDYALLKGGASQVSFDALGRASVCMVGPFGYGDQTAATNDNSKLTDLGKAVCSLQHWRGTLDDHDDSEVSAPHIEETFDRISTLAAAMDEADFVPDGLGLRNSEQATTVGDVIGGLKYAGEKSAAFVAGIAGDALGAVAGAIVGSPIFWAAAFGVIAWKVLR